MPELALVFKRGIAVQKCDNDVGPERLTPLAINLFSNAIVGEFFVGINALVPLIVGFTEYEDTCSAESGAVVVPNPRAKEYLLQFRSVSVQESRF
jgi:hypothetical protein